MIEQYAPEEVERLWAELVPTVYKRIQHVGPGHLRIELTPVAEHHLMTLAVPREMRAEWRARPGSDPRLSLRRIPFFGRGEWLAGLGAAEAG